MNPQMVELTTKRLYDALCIK